jgi:hypothetical protein
MSNTLNKLRLSRAEGVSMYMELKLNFSSV